MSKFLNDFLITMPGTQRNMLLQLLQEKENNGLIRSDNEFKKEMERLIAQLDESDGQPTFQAIHQENRTNSTKYNANLEAIAFDLATIFESSNTIERLLGNHHQLSRSSLSEIRKKITDMRSKVERLKLLIDDEGGSTDRVYEEFQHNTLSEVREDILENLRKERFGEKRDSIFNAEVIGGALQLAGIESTNQLRTNYGRTIANIKVKNRIGLMADESNYPIENAIDGSPYSFWAESVLVDDVIVQNIEHLWSHDYHDYPKSGAMCEVEIELNGLSTVSELRLDPYATYPLEVVSIHGYENKNKTGQMYELISPNHQSQHQRSKNSVEQMIFQFPSVEVSLIRILIRQQNYTKENFMINEEELGESKLWDSLASNKDLVNDYANPGETVAEFDKRNEINGWSVYLSKLTEWAEIFRQEGLVEAAKRAMEVVRIGDYKNPLLLSLYALDSKGDKEKVNDKRSPLMSASWKPVNKLSYLYGAYDISLFGRTYHRSSIHITKELPLSSNAHTLSLTTDEKHHYISVGPDEVDSITNMPIQNSSKITDIEYYITDRKHPEASEWKSILPANHKYVEGELLLGDDGLDPCQELLEAGTINFSLRFPFVSRETLLVKRNGVPMNRSMYLLCDNAQKVGIKRNYYSPTSIYTVDYKPAESAYFIDLKDDIDIEPTQFINDKGEVGEKFQSIDQHNKVMLSHMPYLHRDYLYDYEETSGRYSDNKSVLNASSFTYPLIVRVQGEEYKNITDYTNNTYDPDRLKENNGKAFAHIKNEIIFGHPTDNTPLENISVDYFYMTTSVRMKAILRRNHAGHNSVTPGLFSYSLKTQSYDQDR